MPEPEVVCAFRSGRRARRALAAPLVLVSRALALVAPALALVIADAAIAQEDGPIYDVFIEARVVPSERLMRVSIETGRGARHLKQAIFRIDPERHLGFGGDGEIAIEGDRVSWTPPPTGGALHYSFRIDHLRDDRGYDSRGANTWAVFRGGDMVPAAFVRFSDGARSRTRLQFVLPEGWSVAAPYTRLRGGVYRVEHDDRSFDRPTGWFALGDLGATVEEVAGTKVNVAGPVRHGVRRLDMLAMLRWNLPELNRIMGKPMERLLVVSAGDPMWRGGLSGPGSMFIHATRPLISNDGTSPLLHEVVHVAMGAYADDRADWIVEGLAEYYSLELLGRSGTLDPKRVQEQLDMAVAAYEAGSTKGPGSSRTWRGVGYLVRLDANIEARTEGRQSLDDVLRVLVSLPGESDLAKLRVAVAEATGLDPDEVLPPPPAGREPRSPSGGSGASKSSAESQGPSDPGATGKMKTESFSVPLPIETPAPGE